MKEIFVSTIFVKLALQGAKKQRLGTAQLLRSHNISPNNLNDIKHRILLEDFSNLTADLMAQMDDEYLGLMEKQQPLGSFKMMCRAVISTQTFSEAIKRTAEFWNLFRNSYTHKVVVSDNVVQYQLVPRGGRKSMPLNQYAAETLLATIHRSHCWLVGQFIPITSVSMNYSKPEQSGEYLPSFYGAKRYYNKDVCQIEFDAKYLASNIIQTSTSLDRYLARDNMPSSVLYQPKQYRSLGDQVQQFLERSINENRTPITLNLVAKNFDTSPQSLYRQLQSENTFFNELKRRVRVNRATDLLSSNAHNIEDIATMTGFVETSAFTRAFKQWTGLTPSQYRNNRLRL